MIPTFAQRLEQSSRRLIPLACTILFVFLGAVPWPIPHFGSVAPSLGLISVYYWSMHRPDLFRSFTVFAVGVLSDSIHYLPLGLTAFTFVAVHRLVLTQRRFFVGHAFFMLWTGFGLVTLIVMAVHWIAISLLSGQTTAFVPLLIQGLLTITIFPIPAWILIHTQRTLLSQV